MGLTSIVQGSGLPFFFLRNLHTFSCVIPGFIPSWRFKNLKLKSSNPGFNLRFYVTMKQLGHGSELLQNRLVFFLIGVFILLKNRNISKIEAVSIKSHRDIIIQPSL